jgi:hypothetical protein
MGKIERLPNWEILLAEKIAESKTLMFEYGKNDCTIWAANIVKSYTNLVWEATWKNKREALLRHKQMPMEDQVSEILGPPLGNILLTQRGDLVQKDKNINSALGICIGRKVIFLYHLEGICYVDLKDCVYSWRI